MSENDPRAAIVETCRRLEAEGLVAAASGNVSVRLLVSEGAARFAITPSGVRYRELQPEQITLIDCRGSTVSGRERPSSETPTHLAVYEARADAGAIIHTHSIHASALAVTGEAIPVIIDEQVVALSGRVSVAAYAASGTKELARNVVAALEDRRAVLLRNHGALGVGADLEEALDVVMFLERLATTYVLARQIGEVRPLSRENVDARQHIIGDDYDG